MYSRIRARRTLGTVIATGLGLAMLVVVLPGTANAAPGISTDPQVETANVDVGSTITLALDNPSFTLAGNAGATVNTGTNLPVGFTVTTNNIGGYQVTVASTATTLAGTAVGNTATIPIAALQVQGDGTGDAATFTPLSTTPLVVHRQSDPSAEAGDQFTNAYQMTIPFVRSDTYTVALDYVATTL